MRLSVDAERREALWVQIADQLRAQIVDGQLGDGDRLPPAADLAAALVVNQHTVLRAYGSLRDEGLIELRRRRGAVVASRRDRDRLVDRAQALLAEATRQGLSRKDVVRLLEEMG